MKITTLEEFSQSPESMLIKHHISKEPLLLAHKKGVNMVLLPFEQYQELLRKAGKSNEESNDQRSLFQEGF